MARNKGKHARRRDPAERFRIRGDRRAATADEQPEREAPPSGDVDDDAPGTKPGRDREVPRAE